MRHLHPQQAFGQAGLGAQRFLEALPFGCQGLGAFVGALAGLGQAQCVGGALHQRLAELALQRLQPAADGGLGRAQLARGGGEAAGLDDADEGLHQQQAVEGRAHAPSVWQSVEFCV